MIKAILFDWGGVLVKGGKSFGKYMQERSGSEVSDLVGFRRIRIALNEGRITEDEFEAEFLKLDGAKKIPHDFWEQADIVQVLPEMKKLIAEIRDRGIQTGIISNMNHRIANQIQASGGYEGFDPLVISCREGICKPSKRIFDDALAEVDAYPHEIIYIDDYDANLEYVQSLGVHTILAESTDQVIRDVKRILKTQK